ncbi:MAG: M23 family metallopeptidase [Rectinema subterraneum]|uniref:M23 family metallopeptidase n=1 Tax=Rectinema subterraneum TaxID=2653714 RepID=UPI003C7C1705
MRLPSKPESLFWAILAMVMLLTACTMNNNEDDIWTWGNYPELGTGPVEFKVVPLDKGTFNEITPMGHMNLPQHPIPTSAGGFQFSDNGYSQPVKAPANGIITAIRYTHVLSPDGTKSFPDYAVRIYHTNTFITWFDHLSAIDEAILAKTGTLKEGWTKTYVPVKAGDVFGKTAASPDQVVGLGMYAYDKEKTLDFINPEKYGPFGAHAVFAFDYFQEDIKTNLFAYIKRTAEPRGGKIDFDVAGTLSGNWIVEGSDVISSPDPWNYWLAFVYDMYYPESRRISIGVELGKMIGKSNGILTQPVEGPAYTEATTGSLPVVYKLADATEGMNSVPSISDIKYTLLAQVMEENKIKVELFNGNIDSPSFTGSEIIYTR